MYKKDILGGDGLEGGGTTDRCWAVPYTVQYIFEVLNCPEIQFDNNVSEKPMTMGSSTHYLPYQVQSSMMEGGVLCIVVATSVVRIIAHAVRAALGCPIFLPGPFWFLTISI